MLGGVPGVGSVVINDNYPSWPEEWLSLITHVRTGQAQLPAQPIEFEEAHYRAQGTPAELVGVT